MGKHTKTLRSIEGARKVLEEDHPMTLRQIHYELVSRHVTKNTKSAYHALSKALVHARREGIIPWEWMEDRTRIPRSISMWDDLQDFAECCMVSYRRNVWVGQPNYIEVWLEKDSLSGHFLDVLEPYGVTLNVARGFDGWSSIHDAAERFQEAGAPGILLYFGDFDSSGVYMPISLKERLADQGAYPNIMRCALTLDDIERYKLPPDFAKKSDSRTPWFIAQYGDIAVELEALPKKVLRERIKEEVTKYMDLSALEAVRQLEERENSALQNALQEIA